MQDSFEMISGAGFSEACERNKQPILEVLRTFVSDGHRVLEVGSGTGQHAVYFAANFPRTTWQPADKGDYLPGLRVRLQAAATKNVLAAIDLDVRMKQWPVDALSLIHI